MYIYKLIYIYENESINKHNLCLLSFPRGSVVKNLPASAGDAGSISGLGRSPGEGNDNPLQYPCLGNPMDRGAWRATVPGVARVGQDLATKQHTMNLSQSSYFIWTQIFQF